MILFIFLIHMLGWVPSAESEHPIHISRSEINYDAESKAIQITLHVFIDDLEDAMVMEGFANPKIGAKSELKNSDLLILEYFKKKFEFYNAKKEVLKYSWIGKELGDSPLALVCYMEIENVSSVKLLTVKNDLMMDLYDDQVNIMETFVNNRPKHAFHVKKKGQLKELEF